MYEHVKQMSQIYEFLIVFLIKNIGLNLMVEKDAKIGSVRI